jgi:hypothetical protein
MPDPRVLVHVRIPADLLERLDAAADERLVGRNLMVSAAISGLLETLLSDEGKPKGPEGLPLVADRLYRVAQ